MAGHSKWANIQHRKRGQDAKRGKLFTKLIREITVSARMGGGDPAANPRLRAAVDKALAGNMTKDTIERAIKRGSGDQDGAPYYWYVSCWDEAGNVFTNSTFMFVIEAPPNVTLDDPPNQNITDNQSVILTYTPRDDVDITECRIYVDGTLNYTRGVPIFATSLALWKKNEPIYGIISFPKLGETIHAIKNIGFFLNDKQEEVSKTSEKKRNNPS